MRYYSLRALPVAYKTKNSRMREFNLLINYEVNGDYYLIDS